MVDDLREMPEYRLEKVPPDQFIQEGFIQVAGDMRQLPDADRAKP